MATCIHGTHMQGNVYRNIWAMLKKANWGSKTI